MGAFEERANAAVALAKQLRGLESSNTRKAGDRHFQQQLAQVADQYSALPAEVLEQIRPVMMAWPDLAPVTTLVGQPVMGDAGSRQMAVRVNSVGPAYYPDLQDLVAPERVAALLQQPPKRFGEVSFGWVDPAKPDGQLVYEAPGVQAQQGQALAPLVQQAVPQALAKAGFEPGDLVMNQPVGLWEGDYRRAKRYMTQGFGLPDVAGEQLARLDQQLRFTPELLTPAYPGLLEQLIRPVA